MRFFSRGVVGELLSSRAPEEDECMSHRNFSTSWHDAWRRGTMAW